MKYIRTKDDVLLQDMNNYKYWAWLQTEPTTHDIISEADTIEELCDEFVVIRPQPQGTDHYILHRFVFVKEHCLNGYEMVYGAIWTDKGLIYVAKMNEKGELELL